jgi:antagonist of KipI
MSVRVVRPGLLSTVQDLGRYGLQHLGIVRCGAMDSLAHEMANALVGNDAASATLECTILGPELAFEEDSLIALYGGIFADRRHALPANRPILVSAGTTISLGSTMRGSRAYLAIAGGFAVDEVLGSRSTYLPAKFGGLSGRPLEAGDRLDTVPDVARLSHKRFAGQSGVVTSGRLRSVRWSAPELSLPHGHPVEVRAMMGRHHDQFDDASREAFFSEPWRVSPHSNRMAYRLEGPRLKRRRAVEVLSEPTCLGTVQVPNDGTPIVLMADHQTTGGYPKIAEVASADIPRLAQVSPGASVRFVRCSVEAAYEGEDEARERFCAVRDAVRNRLSS